MIHALAVLTFAMLGYMFWSLTFRLRRDRLRAIRNCGRRGILIAARQRVRASLTRAFVLPAHEPDWEAHLLANLEGRERE